MDGQTHERHNLANQKENAFLANPEIKKQIESLHTQEAAVYEKLGTLQELAGPVLEEVGDQFYTNPILQHELGVLFGSEPFNEGETWESVASKYSPDIVSFFQSNQEKVAEIVRLRFVVEGLKEMLWPEVRLEIQRLQKNLEKSIDYAQWFTDLNDKSGSDVFNFLEYDLQIFEADIPAGEDRVGVVKLFDRYVYFVDSLESFGNRAQGEPYAGARGIAQEEKSYVLTAEASQHEKPLDESQKATETHELVGVPALKKMVDFSNDAKGLGVARQEDSYIHESGLFTALGRLLEDNQGSLPNYLEKNPRAIHALAQLVTQERASFGTLFQRQEWHEIIDVDRIYAMITAMEQARANIDVVSADKVLDEAYAQYNRIFETPSPIKTRHRGSDAAADNAFVHEVHSILDAAGTMLPLDQRMLQTSMVALYYLFNSGKIDALYDRYLQEAAVETPPSAESKKRIQAELAFGFLQRQATKNREREQYEGSFDATTIGMEWEHFERLEHMMRTPFDLRESIDTLKKGMTPEAKIAHPEAYAEAEKIIRESELDIEFVEEVLYGNDETLRDKRQQELRELLQTTPTVMDIVSTTGAFHTENKTAPFYREAITAPSAGHQLQQRQECQLRALHGMEGYVNPHFSIGNHELSPEHPGASDIFPAVIAAGWMEIREDATEEIEADFLSGKRKYGEQFWKLTDFGDGKLRYLPFHYVRDNHLESDAIVQYNTSHAPKVWELRSFPKDFGKAKNFENRVRTAAFLKLSVDAEKAAQVPEKYRNSIQRERAVAWQKYISNWKALLTKAGIEYPPLEDRFAEVTVDHDNHELIYAEPEKGQAYARYIGVLSVRQSRDVLFRAEARKIIRQFRQEMGKILSR